MMSYSRRQLTRLLRMRNLLLLTIIVILLYLMKTLSHDDTTDQDLEMLQEPERIISGEKGHFVPLTINKIDWHDYQQINEEMKRVGIGEQGKPAYLPKSEAEKEKELYAVNGFNGALSDKIPLNRSLPDIRHPKCEKMLYLSSLPTVSVVVPFHNEHWSTLLRTAFSVLHRSPDHLIKEVFLVDDASTKEFLKGPLEQYLAQHMPRVRVLRLAQRSGLITARLEGARAASGDVLVFLDSHTEANVNWLPPLLEPIALNPRTVTCPFIDVIAFDTFEYRAQDEGARGAFDWELFYKRLPVLPKDEENMPQPFESPVMAGGLFAISREFFWRLGGYDPGLDIWGGEQYELSFKVWQCGGRMVDVPCSRVGHIYWKFAPFPNPGHGDFVGRNYRRVAEVWMDEYAEYLYQRRPHYRHIQPGDLAGQRALRKKLHCKPFKWFMKRIAFDLVGKYPPVEPQPFARGAVSPHHYGSWGLLSPALPRGMDFSLLYYADHCMVRPEHKTELCVDMHQGAQNDKLEIKPCTSSPQAEQSFVFSWHKDIRSSSRAMCWDLPESSPGSAVLLYGCHLGGGNQLWRYDLATKQIKHGEGDKQCLECSPQGDSVYINSCQAARPDQRWLIDHLNEEMLRNWTMFRSRVTGPEDYP